MFKALYSHVNNIIDKYIFTNLQPYPNYITMSKKKKEKIKTETNIKLFYS